ncbi:MAG: hypothetical protein V3R25_00065, partial [Nitrosomonadaceae bacterium]
IETPTYRLDKIEMLRYFPEINITYAHRKRDYLIAVFTFVCVAISLNIDASGSIEKQNLMGKNAWVFLIGLLFGENKMYGCR